MMGFAGMERDTVTGLNLAVNRVQRIRGRGGGRVRIRWGSRAGDADLYRYVGNAPTNQVDPEGLGEPATGMTPTHNQPQFPRPPFPAIPTSPIKGGSAPTGWQLLNHPKVRTAICAAWAKSQKNPPGFVHEEGGWIYMDPDGNITVVPTPSGPKVPWGEDGSTNHGHPPWVSGAYLVGTFHTHPYNWFPSPPDWGIEDVTSVPNIIIHKSGYCVYGWPTRRGGLGGSPGFPWPPLVLK